VLINPEQVAAVLERDETATVIRLVGRSEDLWVMGAVTRVAEELDVV
jgi:hypothetical protein